MRCLVIHAHPVETSYGAALRDCVMTTLTQAGHEVRLIDLYAEGFEPALSRAERLAYHKPGENERNVERHIAHLKWAQAMVFVYPTWWYGLPAILKGWFDRVWLPHVTFTLPAQGRIRGLMDNVVRLVIVTTAGASWPWLTLMGNPGRHTIMRGVRALCHLRCRRIWLAHYSIDQSTPDSRAAFLARVAGRLSAL
ncbi:MAG: NAD(P)H-dependent oxidoreductase [Alphaproteobacteria bacterium]|nr:NAD(P)H-dependent oxidoreductase [Alphaproteobacteria bacterium]